MAMFHHRLHTTISFTCCYFEPYSTVMSITPRVPSTFIIKTILKSSYNNSQAISVAIQSSETHQKFTLSLVQGPPVTGKTRTVVAIVGVLLASPSQMCSRKLVEMKKRSNNPFTNLRQKISETVAISRAWQDAALAKQLNAGEERG